MEIISFEQQNESGQPITWGEQWYDSSACLYVPWFAAFTGKTVELDYKDKLLMWQKPKASYGRVNTVYSLLPDSFMNKMVFHGLWNNTQQYKIMAMKGYMAQTYTEEHQKIKHTLLSLAVRGDYVFNIKKDSPLDHTQFALIWNYRLLEDRALLPVKRVFMSYIREARIKKLNMLETDNVDQWIFQSSFKAPNFRSVKEQTEYMTQQQNLIYEQ
jgi:hypothetical protein